MTDEQLTKELLAEARLVTTPEDRAIAEHYRDIARSMMLSRKTPTLESADYMVETLIDVGRMLGVNQINRRNEAREELTKQNIKEWTEANARQFPESTNN